ncbi:MAG: class I SAM-dependent methyltransferase [Acidobacteria bacterium]|nr:class I SAM-dependent methyltransferase [Acidobacteriota bacterium]
MNLLRKCLVDQFGNPSGPLGWLAGQIMRWRPSNLERSRLGASALGVLPGERVLEIGFGPGLAIREILRLEEKCRVVGIDRSPLMLAQAKRLNWNAVSAGQVELLRAEAEALPDFSHPFDKVLAINVFMFWKDPGTVLRGIRRVMSPGGSLVLVVQPRSARAGETETREAGVRMQRALSEAGYSAIEFGYLDLTPVRAACVRGRAES